MNCEVKGQHQTGIWPAPVQGFGPNQVFVLSGNTYLYILIYKLIYQYLVYEIEEKFQ